jgi:hypothetical protein
MKIIHKGRSGSLLNGYEKAPGSLGIKYDITKVLRY